MDAFIGPIRGDSSLFLYSKLDHENPTKTTHCRSALDS